MSGSISYCSVLDGWTLWITAYKSHCLEAPLVRKDYLGLRLQNLKLRLCVCVQNWITINPLM